MDDDFTGEWLVAHPEYSHKQKRGVGMPGVVSESNRGPSDDSPYVPSWCYKNGPKQCPCGHGENYHNDAGECLLERKCGCVGLPDACRTPFPEVN